jgi:hypothetical protein
MKALLLLIAMLTGCSTYDWHAMNARQEHICPTKGGKIVQRTNFRVECVWPSTDGGSNCSDDAECQGYCAASGQCSADRSELKIRNCVDHLVKGVVVSECVD